MCLILVAYQQHPNYPLILVGNRDEFYHRATQKASFWDTDVLAGRDLECGGTWLGVTNQRRFATITNYRDPTHKISAPVSRGLLVKDYLESEESSETFLNELKQEASQYNGFNLLLGDVDDLYYFSNKENIVHKINAGIYGLSNHLLDTPWPKIEKSKSFFTQIVQQDKINVEDLLSGMQDSTRAEEDLLPRTGLPLEREKELSSIFINTPDYGTVSTSALMIDNDGNVLFVERLHDQEKSNIETNQFEF